MFRINDGIKFVEEDDYLKGCLPETGFSMEMSISFNGELKEDLLNKLMSFHGVDNDSLEINACGERGRVDVHVMEDENSYNVSESDLKEWKAGKKKLYSAIYTYYIYSQELADLG
ncbi:hypothetical protein [Oceanobacillus sp. FSL H7-0719]|uniref:hypothetical protein n=1 Tax=Oceanobacillus sp. FSL H7-0719 TaxID=2954507 RepID=UPI0032566800